jgi:hypothetical protein
MAAAAADVHQGVAPSGARACELEQVVRSRAEWPAQRYRAQTAAPSISPSTSYLSSRSSSPPATDPHSSSSSPFADGAVMVPPQCSETRGLHTGTGEAAGEGSSRLCSGGGTATRRQQQQQPGVSQRLRSRTLPGSWGDIGAFSLLALEAPELVSHWGGASNTTGRSVGAAPQLAPPQQAAGRQPGGNGVVWTASASPLGGSAGAAAGAGNGGNSGALQELPSNLQVAPAPMGPIGMHTSLQPGAGHSRQQQPPNPIFLHIAKWAGLAGILVLAMPGLEAVAAAATHMARTSKGGTRK